MATASGLRRGGGGALSVGVWYACVAFATARGCMAGAPLSCDPSPASWHAGPVLRLRAGATPPTLWWQSLRRRARLLRKQSGSAVRTAASHSGIRHEYEFGQDDEKLFSSVSTRMRQVAGFFAAHALVQALLVTHAGVSQNVAELLGYFSVMDDVWYAYLIWCAADAYHSITTTSGSDVEHLVNGVGRMHVFWSKMRTPLLIQTVVLVLKGLALILGPTRLESAKRGMHLAAAVAWEQIQAALQSLSPSSLGQ